MKYQSGDKIKHTMDEHKRKILCVSYNLSIYYNFMYLLGVTGEKTLDKSSPVKC